MTNGKCKTTIHSPAVSFLDWEGRIPSWGLIFSFIPFQRQNGVKFVANGLEVAVFSLSWRWIRTCWFRLSLRENFFGHPGYEHRKAKLSDSKVLKKEGKQLDPISMGSGFSFGQNGQKSTARSLRFSNVWTDRTCRLRCSDRLNTLPQSSKLQVNTRPWTSGLKDARRCGCLGFARLLLWIVLASVVEIPPTL